MPLNHSERRCIGGRLKLDVRRAENLSVARSLVQDRLQRRILVASAPTPAQPFNRDSGRSFLSDLEVNRDFVRRARHQ